MQQRGLGGYTKVFFRSILATFIMGIVLFPLSSLRAQNPPSPSPAIANGITKKPLRTIPFLFDSCYWASDAPTLLINAICSRISACCSGGICSATLDGCVRALDGDTGKQIWGDFGLNSHENEWTASELRSRIVGATVHVNTSYLCSCIDDITRISCEYIRSNYSSEYVNVENVIPNSGSWCPEIFSVP